MVPPVEPTVSAPSSWLAARPALPFMVKLPPVICKGVVASREVSRPALAKSRTSPPPLMIVLPA
jgi:hypothetical protein